MRKAKILATLGPSSREPEVLEGMLAAGVNAIRINMSHGERSEHVETLKRVRAAAAAMNRPLSVLVDLCGPKIRTGTLAGGGPVVLDEGATFTITGREVPGDANEVSTNYAGMANDVRPGARLLLDDGQLELVVESTTETDVVCRVLIGGVLSERKGINLPGSLLPIPSLTQKDRSDLIWAVEQNADYIALSFVRRAEDCIEAKALIKEANGRAALVAKIEKAEAIDNLDAIIEESDAVMVARGDLGVETSPELVPVYQKRIIRKANDAGKIVVTATQMLQSMVTSQRPTRAEASDVANAVWDGSDAVMLSNETAAGKYPVMAVATMARIIESAETGNPAEDHSFTKWMGKQTGRVSRALCEAAAFAAEEMDTKTTAVFTESGLMARRLAALRPNQQIVALTSSANVRNELSLIWGVMPLIHKPGETAEEILEHGEKTLLEAGIVEKGEILVMMAGRLSGLGLSSSVVLYRVGGELGAS
ncbi:MAG: pyruvate kinase [Pyrinomonadaceae bacterium]